MFHDPPYHAANSRAWALAAAMHSQSAVFSVCDIARPWLPACVLWAHLLETILSHGYKRRSLSRVSAQSFLCFSPLGWSDWEGFFILFSRATLLLLLLLAIHALSANTYPLIQRAARAKRKPPLAEPGEQLRVLPWIVFYIS